MSLSGKGRKENNNNNNKDSRESLKLQMLMYHKPLKPSLLSSSWPLISEEAALFTCYPSNFSASMLLVALPAHITVSCQAHNGLAPRYVVMKPVVCMQFVRHRQAYVNALGFAICLRIF